MGITSFRSPLESVEKYQQAMDMISLIQEVVRTPGIEDKIKDLSAQLVSAVTISEKKKQELQNANERIAQANEALIELEKEKKLHSANIDKANAEIEKKTADIQNAQTSIESQKSALEKVATKNKLETDQKLTESKKLVEAAFAHENKVKDLENAIAEREKQHQEVVAEFEKNYQNRMQELADKQDLHTAAIEKLASEKKKFELRKSKFNELLEE